MTGPGAQTAKTFWLWGYLQTDQENSALSSQLPLLPKQEANQVSDRIQHEVEVKAEE